MEELGDLERERRAAGDRQPQPAPEPLLDLRVDEPVGQPVLERRGRAGPAAPLAQRADPAADASAQSISLRFTPVASSNCATTAACTFS